MMRVSRGHRCPPPEWPPQGDGTVYLLHFAKPYKHARHYLGYASRLESRLAMHRCGRGARLLQVVRQAGIRWRLVRVWSGDRGLERQLKNRGGASRLCPVCRKAAARRAERGAAR
jgi:predicted GIY-YIG superfamily endonuclease